jgi:oligosaccharide repeat unit polymerase
MDNIKSLPYSQIKPILLACQIGIIIFLCLLGILEHQSIFDAATVIYPFCILFAIIVFWCLFSWTIITKSFFSPYILFLIAAALFNGGHIFLEILNINPLGILSNQFSSETILQTIFLVTLSITSLHFGALLSTTTVKSIPTQIVSNLLEESTKTEKLRTLPNHKLSSKLLDSKDIRKVGWILLSISAVPTILLLRTSISAVATSGYVALYEATAAEGGAMKILSTFTIPSALFLLAGSQNKSSSRRIAVLLILIYALIYNFLGQRTNGFLPLVSLAWLWHYVIRPLPKKIFFPILFIMAFVVSPLIAEIRGGIGLERFSLSSIIDKFTSLENPIAKTLFEFGSTMQTIAYTIELVPSHKDFSMGVDYLYALFTLIPNIGFGDVHPSIARGVPSVWLSAEVTPRAVKQGIYLGYSFIAEAYLNFGWLVTPIFMAIFGFYLGKLVLWATRSGEPAKMALLASFLPSLLFFCRQESTQIVRPFVLYSLAPYIGVLLLQRSRIKKSNISTLNSDIETSNAQASIYPYASPYENRQWDESSTQTIQQIPNDLINVASVNSNSLDQETANTPGYKLDELVAVLNKLSSITIQYLGKAVVTQYWRSARSDSSWLAEFEIDRDGHISYPNQKEIVCSSEQLQQIQSWILGYIERCKSIIHNLEQLIEKDCLDNHQQKLLLLTKKLCNFT